MAFSASSVSLLQGETSPAISVTINAEHSFADSVQVSLANLPNGVTTNPVSPFSVSPNPDGALANGAKVAVGGVAGYLNCGPARVAATSAQTVFAS